MAKARPARLDPKGTVKPLTVFRGKKPTDGHCYDPNRIQPTELVHQDPNDPGKPSTQARDLADYAALSKICR